MSYMKENPSSSSKWLKHYRAVRNSYIVVKKHIKANYLTRFNSYAFLKHVANIAMILSLSSFQISGSSELEGGNIKYIQGEELQA